MRKATPVDHLFWESDIVITCGGSKQNAPHPFCKTCGGCLVPECEAFTLHESSALKHFSPDGTCPFEKLARDMEVHLKAMCDYPEVRRYVGSDIFDPAYRFLTRLEAQRKG